MMMFLQRTEQQQHQQQQQQHRQQQQQSYDGSNGVFDLRGIQGQVNQELSLRQRANAAPANGVAKGTGRGRAGNHGSPPHSAPPNRESGKFFEGVSGEQQKSRRKSLWILQLLSWPAERLSGGL